MTNKRSEPLRLAARVQRAAARQGFDWPRRDPRLWAKLAEEIAELRRAQGNRRRATEELGDLLFMVVNLSRHLRVDAAAALAAAVRKFERRYAHVLKRARALPRRGGKARLEQLEQFWQEAKRLEARKLRATVRRVASSGGSPNAHRRRR
jgi:tetrapyrrole methylase family protein / MazG family protein